MFSIGKYLTYFMQPILNLVLLTPIQGALSTLYAATSTEIISKNIRDKYIVPIDTVSSSVHSSANDQELVEKLWRFSEAVMKDFCRQFD
jgi:hypothetical protein